jgi:hypothetical protein
MKDIFAPIYETFFGLYNQAYDLIFRTLFENGGYVKFGLSFIFIPLICWLLFYYVWKYPYGKKIHWFIWLFITCVIVFGVTYSIANIEIFASGNQALKDSISDASTGYKKFADNLPLQYALYNSLLTLVIGFIYSLFLKQFSKIQIHLPF